MEPRLARARESVDSAAELTDDSTIHEQLNSIGQALNALSADLPADATPESEVPANASPESAEQMESRPESSRSTDDTAGDASVDVVPDETSTAEPPESEVPADATPADDSEMGARLEQIERQLAELGDDAEGRTAEHIATARDQIDAFRREEARDWE